MIAPRIRRTLGLAAPFALLLPAAPAQANSDVAELTYECALAFDFASKKGVRHSVGSQVAMAEFDAVTARDSSLREPAVAAVTAVWDDYLEANGRKSLDRYILGVAQDCADYYGGKAAQQQASVQQADPREGQLNALGTLSVDALKAYFERTGDAPAVADYLVYHYPYGKDLFKPNEDGEFLSQLIVQAGKDGLRRWGDEAVFAIANKFYWQYNPPATRLIFAEYQRRMRQMRMNEAQAEQWAQRAADDRAQQARMANAKPVGSLGNGLKTATPGSGIVVCTTFGDSRSVCREEK
jgi:hypothetical protein